MPRDDGRETSVLARLQGQVIFFSGRSSARLERAHDFRLSGVLEDGAIAPNEQRSAPTLPRSLQAATSARIFFLYAAVKRLCCAFDYTSVMGIEDK